MKRREFITLVGGAAAWPIVAHAQQRKLASIGFLLPSSYGGEAKMYFASFRKGLADHGRLEGQHYRIELRSAEGVVKRLPLLAAELVTRKVDVIVVSSALAALAAAAATKTVPIVQVAGGDLVGIGLAASLARPGGNVTGLVNQSEDKTGKLLEFLLMAVPSASRIGVLFVSNAPMTAPQMEDLRSTAQALRVMLHPVGIASGSELDDAFADLARQNLDGLIVFSAALLGQLRDRIVALAAKASLPAVYPYPEYASFGGFICYGLDRNDNYRQAARFVDRILNGTRPGDLPIEQPTKFKLVINLKTAKALGLTLPATLLAFADEVIE